MARVSTKGDGRNAQTCNQDTGGERGEEWKIKKSIDRLFSIKFSQSISQQRRQAGKASKHANEQAQQAHSSLHKGVPPGAEQPELGMPTLFPSNHKQPPPEKKWRPTDGGGWEEWRIEDRGSTNQLPGGPHLSLDTKGSLTRSSKGKRGECAMPM